MSILLSSLLTGFCEFIEDTVVDSVADSGSTNSLIDSALSIYPEGYFEMYYIYITGGAATGDIRLVESFTKTSGTIVPHVDFSGAIGAGDTFQLKKTNTYQAQKAINDAIISVYPKLHRKIVFESLGLSLLTSNADAAQPDVVVADATLFFEGQEVTISDDSASEDATIAEIDTATNTLTMEDDLTNAYTTAAHAKVTAKSGHYFNLGATIGNGRVTGVFLRADTTSKRKQFLECEIIRSLVGDRQIYFPSSKSVDDQTWIIKAIARLEAVSDPSDPITLDEERVDLLYAMAAYHFYKRQANDISSGDTRRILSLAQAYLADVMTTYKRLWMVLPTERASTKTDIDED